MCTNEYILDYWWKEWFILPHKRDSEQLNFCYYEEDYSDTIRFNDPPGQKRTTEKTS